MKLPMTQTQDGYSLIEIMVAGTVLGLSIIAITAFMRSTTDLQTKADMRRHAAQILTNTIESSELHPTGHQEFCERKWSCGIPSTKTCTIPGSTTCSIQQTVTPDVLPTVEGEAIPNVTRVDITIAWDGETLSDFVYLAPLVYAYTNPCNVRPCP